MKKLFYLGIALCLSLGAANSYAVRIDISKGTLKASSEQIISAQNIRIGNLNNAWATFAWDGEKNAFNLVDFGPQSTSGHGLEGEWKLYYNWENSNCDQKKDFAVVKMDENGTFGTNDNNKGKWTLKDTNVVLAFDNGYTVYTGTLNGNLMKGTMVTQGGSGCWHAERINFAPAPTLLDGLDSTGKAR